MQADVAVQQKNTDCETEEFSDKCVDIKKTTTEIWSQRWSVHVNNSAKMTNKTH